MVARRAEHNFTLAQLYFFFTIFGMVIASSPHYWMAAFGRGKGRVTSDEEEIGR